MLLNRPLVLAGGADNGQVRLVTRTPREGSADDVSECLLNRPLVLAPQLPVIAALVREGRTRSSAGSR